MRLLGAELRRFWARRAVAVVLLLAAVLVGLLAASAAWSSRPATSEELEAAQVQIDATEEMFEADIERCREAPEEYFGGPAVAEQCEDLRPRPEDYVGRSALDLGEERRARGLAVVVVLVGAAVVLGATFSGADWSSGSMGTQLVFEPRRVRVWLAKGLAVTVSVTLAAALLLAGFWTVLYAVARTRGLDVLDPVLTGVLAQSGRSLALVAAAALGAHSLTMLLRSTVGTLGLLFGYAVAGEIVVASLPFDKMSQWSLANNVQAWIAGGTEVYDPSICAGTSGLDGSCTPVYLLSTGHGAAYLAVLLLVVVLVSPPAFRRRDVT